MLCFLYPCCRRTGQKELPSKDGVLRLLSGTGAAQFQLAPAPRTPFTVAPAGSQTFTVLASSPLGTLHYQWQKDGVNVGTDSSSLSLSNLALAASPALAQNAWKAGNWNGAPYFNGQQFSHCAMTVNYTDGTQLILQLTAQLQMFVGAGTCNTAIQLGLTGYSTSNADSCASGTMLGSVV